MKYTDTHEWVRLSENGEVTVGITTYAQKELGEIVYVELPKVKQLLRQEEEMVVLESTKAAVDLYTPLSGEVISVNELLIEFPQKISQDPMGEGWLLKLKMTDPSEYDSLLDEKEYQNLLHEK